MKRILVIDDDTQVRQLLRLMLEQAGYEVLVAGKEGIETIRELQRDYPEVKIIAISGGGRVRAEDYLKTADRFGVARTFIKPFKREELLEAIQELFGVPATA